MYADHQYNKQTNDALPLCTPMSGSALVTVVHARINATDLCNASGKRARLESNSGLRIRGWTCLGGACGGVVERGCVLLAWGLVGTGLLATRFVDGVTIWVAGRGHIGMGWS